MLTRVRYRIAINKTAHRRPRPRRGKERDADQFRRGLTHDTVWRLTALGPSQRRLGNIVFCWKSYIILLPNSAEEINPGFRQHRCVCIRTVTEYRWVLLAHNCPDP